MNHVDKKGSLHCQAVFSRVLVVGVPCLVLVCLFAFFTPCFYGADDIHFEELLGGYITGSPESHLYFIKYPLSFALYLLYTYIPFAPWYALSLLSVHVGGLVLVLFRCYQYSPSRPDFLLIGAALYLIVDISFMVNLEWTTTAGVAAACAAIWFAMRPSRYRTRIASIIDYGICLALIFIAYNLRTESFLLMVPIMLIIYILKIISTKRKFPLPRSRQDVLRCVKMLGFPLACIAVCLISSSIHSVAYSSDDWVKYSEYTNYRSTIVDYSGLPNFAANRAFFENLGISEDQYKLFYDQNYTFGAYDVDINSFREIADLAKEQGSRRGLMGTANEALGHLYNLDLFSCEVVILLFFCIGVYMSRRSQRTFMAVFAVTLYFACIWFYFSNVGRMIYRVECCLLFTALAGFVSIVLGSYSDNRTCCWERNSDYSPFFARLRYAVIALALVLVGFYVSYDTFRDNGRNELLCEEGMTITSYESLQSDQIILKDIWSFVSVFQPAFDGHEYLDGSKAVWMGGWFYGTPDQTKQLKHLGFGGDVVDILLDNRAVVAVSDMRSNPEGVCDMIKMFFWDELGLDVEYKVVDSLDISKGRQVYYYQFEQVEEEA